MKTLIAMAALLFSALLVIGCEMAASHSSALYVAEADRPAMEAVHTRDDGDGEGDGGRFDASLQAGTLTAGSFDDLANPTSYRQLAQTLLQSDRITSELASVAHTPTVLKVLGSDGRPAGDLPITVTANGRTARFFTRSDGRLVLTRRDIGADAVEISTEGLAPTQLALDGKTHELQIDRDAAPLPAVLDLAFIVDCTGSMSDELEYLKVELRSIVQAIDEQFPGVKRRYALICYRDRGDQYVTRVFDFTDSLTRFLNRLGKQRADGGGDYEEAVHEALAAGAKLNWSSRGAARIVFHIGDAPPHAPDLPTAARAIDQLKQRGVVIYPVAASGVNPVLEFLMRSAALSTGARYLFITDHSGVGNPHAPPHVPSYDVEILRDLMIRMIATELSGQPVAGRPIATEPAEIVDADPQQPLT